MRTALLLFALLLVGCDVANMTAAPPPPDDDDDKLSALEEKIDKLTTLVDQSNTDIGGLKTNLVTMKGKVESSKKEIVDEITAKIPQAPPMLATPRPDTGSTPPVAPGGADPTVPAALLAKGNAKAAERRPVMTMYAPYWCSSTACALAKRDLDNQDIVDVVLEQDETTYPDFVVEQADEIGYPQFYWEVPGGERRFYDPRLGNGHNWPGLGALCRAYDRSVQKVQRERQAKALMRQNKLQTRAQTLLAPSSTLSLGSAPVFFDQSGGRCRWVQQPDGSWVRMCN